jgi:RIO-like serine/threonine protein kinase
VGVREMIPFVPVTNNVNQDRLYFTDGATFVKMDSNFGRGRRESDMLTLLADAWYAPRLHATFDRPGYFCTRMDLCPGETLENVKNLLEPEEKRILAASLLRIVEDLLHRGIVHGDLNERNILFDRESRRVFLIDWETAMVEDSLRDLYKPWGLLNLLEKIA